MSFSGLTFASPEFLQLVEGHGLTGTWNWFFATDEHFWSPGLYQLLGLQADGRRPSYDLFLSLVHPDDRRSLATADHFLQGVAVKETTVRVIHRNGTTRSLSVRCNVYFTADGRPIAAGGSMLDVTDRDRQAQARAASRRRQATLCQRAGILTFSMTPDRRCDFPLEAEAYFGLPLDEISANPWQTIGAASRTEFIDNAMRTADEGLIFRMQPLCVVGRGKLQRINVLRVPVYDALDDLVEWSIVHFPIQGAGTLAARSVREGLEQAVTGHHLRAARAMLNWSMTELAQAGGMSLSTVKRLEEDADSQSVASRHKAVAALRRAGIRFIILDNGALAVSTN